MPKMLILASASPRRAKLLRAIGLDFAVRVSHAAEVTEGLPRTIVSENALTKARAIADDPNALVIGADTIVVLDGAVFGKPVDAADAARMLTALSSRTHEVYTGVCVLDAATGHSAADVSVTRVTFVDILPDEIRQYVATGDPLDKAGAYGIQGMARMFVESIEGNWDGVMGLPTSIVRKLLHSVGYCW